jgi:tRNA (uracil-5-)-methyltransferase
MPLSAVEPDRYQALLAEKSAAVSALLAGFDPPPAELHASSPTGFRYRAEFRMWHDGDALDYVMFQPESPKTPVRVHAFPIACDAIQRLMPALRARLRDSAALRRKLFQVEFLSTLAGDTLVTLIYHRPLDEAWESAARPLESDLGIAVIGRSRREKRVLSRDHVNEVLPIAGRNYRYRQYEQAFSQPNAPLNICMIEWALRQAAPLRDDLLELYCGNGNFTLPLASAFDRVIATELSKASTRAARENLAANDVQNVEIVRLAAEEVTEAMAGTRSFRRLAGLPRPLQDYRLNTLFVDPPRAGLDPHTEAMAARFGHVIYISCNPQTLASNLRALSRTHRVTSFAQFDQFPYTPHMECGVLLRHKGH